MSKKYLGIFVVLVFVIGLFGCGGSKGGGGQAEPKPAPITSATGETVGAVVGNLAGELSGGAILLGDSISQPKLKKSRLGRIVRPLIARKKGLIDFPDRCDSGTLSTTATQSQDKKTITITEVYNNCVEKYGFNQQGQCPTNSSCFKTTYSGRIVSEFTNPNWTTAISDPILEDEDFEDFIDGVNKIKGTYTNFKDVWEKYQGSQITDKSEDIVNGSVVINFESETRTSFSFNIVHKGEDILPQDEAGAVTMTYNMGIIIEDKTENNNEIEQTTINGGITFKMTSPENKTESLSFTNYIIKEWDVTSPQSGTMATIDGGMTLALSCINGKVTVKTTQAIFTPTPSYGYYGYCPTAGKIEISGSGTATIEHTSTGGVKVYVNDNLVNIYTSCEELELCDGESIFAGIIPLYENRKLMIAKSQGCRWNKS